MKLILSVVFLFASLPILNAGDLGRQMGIAPGYGTQHSLEKAAEKSVSFKQLLQSIAQPDIKDLDFSFPKPKADENFVLRGDERFFITVMASTREERTRLMELGLDIQEIYKTKVSGIAHQKTVALLSQKGYVIEDKITLADYAHNFFKDFPSADAAYHNYDEMIEVLQAITAANSDIVSLYSIGKSLEGREIWTLRINSNAKGTEKSNKPGAVFIGDHHAREHISVEVPLLHAAWLLENRNQSDIKNYIETLDIYIIPMLNPDGAEYDIATGRYRWHRKNTRKNPDGNIGVDLNRNYDFRWGGAGASHSTYSDTYCGPSVFSEPETQVAKKFFESHDNLKTYISYHSYAELVLYPWGGIYDPVENENDRKAFIAMAKEMAALTGYTPKQSSDLYAATGDATDWTYGERGVFSFTIELSPASSWGGGFYPGVSILEKTVKDNIAAANYLLSMTADPYKSLK
ncbi:MAG: M14 family metallopeptidase [Elusimicrobiota bacterium]|nr:M14 family metallopeptidase [Elusimicrobiota bacterium]